MSLYALLPGAPSLGPPTSTAGSSLYRPTNYVTDFVAQAMVKQNNPKPKPRVVLDFSKIESFRVPCKRPHSRSNSLSTADETVSTSSSSASSASTSIRHDQNLKIHVQEVKMNFLKLARPSSQSVVQRGSVCRSKRDARLRRRERQDSHNCSSDHLNSYESAIEFDLRIQFAGRNYSIKRTLHQIAQLRQDLLQEMAFMEKFLQKNNWSDDDDEDASSDSSTSGWDVSDCCDCIPSLPRMSEAGVFGGGFAQMSGMMQAYRPALQSWFQTMVAAVSEDSPILANFVWEPLGAEESDPLHASLTQLGSIQE